MATPETFWRLGGKITGHPEEGSLPTGYRKFKSYFGTTPVVCVAAWDNFDSARPPKSEQKHLLWALLYLKQYCTEHVNTNLVGVTEKTFRKWCNILIRLLAKMPVERKSIFLISVFFKELINFYLFARIFS